MKEKKIKELPEQLGNESGGCVMFEPATKQTLHYYQNSLGLSQNNWCGCVKQVRSTLKMTCDGNCKWI